MMYVARLKSILLFPFILWLIISQGAIHSHDFITPGAADVTHQLSGTAGQSYLQLEICPFCLHGRSHFLLSSLHPFSGIDPYGATFQPGQFVTPPSYERICPGNRSPPSAL